MPTLFGESKRASELGRAVPKRVDLFEVTADPKLPKPSKLRALAAERPKLGFSVVAAQGVFGEDPKASLTLARGAAEALAARYLVVRASASLRPGPSSERRVLEVLSQLGATGAQLVFEPSGLWQRPRVRALCAEAGALFSQRLDELEPAGSLYLRIVQLGTGRAQFGRKLDVLAALVKASADACIIVEGGGVQALRSRLESEMEFLDDPGADDGDSEVDDDDSEVDDDDSEVDDDDSEVDDDDSEVGDDEDLDDDEDSEADDDEDLDDDEEQR